MTLRVLTGFETQSLAEMLYGGTTPTIETTTKRSGSAAVKISCTTTLNCFVNPRAPNAANGMGAIINAATAYVTFWFYPVTLPSTAGENEEFFAVNDTGAARKFSLRISDTGVISAYDGTQTLLGTGTTQLQVNTWYRIDVKIGSGASAAWESRINKTTEISGTNSLSTANTADIYLGKHANRNGNGVAYIFDDVTVTDNAWYSDDYNILPMQPDSDGTYTAWTASAGSDWDCVEEIPPSETDYISSTNTIGDATTVNFESASAAGIPTGATIIALREFAYLKRAGSTNGSIKFRVRSGTTDSDTSSAATITGTPQYGGLIFETDPATSVAWTLSGLDGVQAGVIEQHASRITNCHQIILQIAFIPSTGDNLEATNITTEPAVLGQPSIGQTHELEATNITTEPAILGQPTIGQTYNLEATNITTEPAVLGQPSIGQIHELEATNITSGVPELGAPTLTTSQADNLIATDITSGIPELGTPSIGQTHELEATNITSGIPELGIPTIGQVHELEANEILSGIPELGTPSIGQTHELIATDINAGIPILGAPILSQNLPDELIATDIASGIPELGTPSISQTHELIAINITSGIPELGIPAIGQTHELIPIGILAGIPVLESPTIGQMHILLANNITSGIPILGAPVCWSRGPTPTPDERIYKILADDRTLTILEEDREVIIDFEDRTVR